VRAVRRGIQNTKILDTSGAETKVGTLSDVFAFGPDYLGIRSDVSIEDTTDGEHEFDFKYDDESEKFGAGTAFLHD
jgi:hypothetical protein